MKPVYSIVAPVYNEAKTLPLFYERVRDSLNSTGETWELVMVNDGSRDESLPVMLSLAQTDARVKVVNFARNFGHQVAVTAGIDYATGSAVVLIDSDLQDPPEVILDLIVQWKAGFDVVYAVRTKREGETWFKRTTAKAFYRFIYQITEVNIPLDTGDFRLMDEKVVRVLRQMREHNRFIRGMTGWIGFKQTGVGYIRKPRHAGETKYPLKKMIGFAADAITSFSFFPLQIMIYMSGMLGVLAVIAGIVISVLRITRGGEYFGGQATTIVVLLLLSSFQMFFLFIIGQYVARIYDETRDRPLYVVASTQGFELQPPATRLSSAGPGSLHPITQVPEQTTT
ncbi:MAG: glycosyltransferase family 2 protein [Anaerolineae bacterium]|nr:glycosyltransferase family 2 protein [Anaerolineae bacterium]